MTSTHASANARCGVTQNLPTRTSFLALTGRFETPREITYRGNQSPPDLHLSATTGTKATIRIIIFDTMSPKQNVIFTVFAFLLPVALGFHGVIPNRTFRPSTCSSSTLLRQPLYAFRNDRDEITALYYKNDPQEVTIDIDSISLEDLPRSAMERQVQAKQSTPVALAEIYIGRVAMVAAVILFSTEILTGKSLPEQILSGLF